MRLRAAPTTPPGAAHGSSLTASRPGRALSRCAPRQAPSRGTNLPTQFSSFSGQTERPFLWAWERVQRRRHGSRRDLNGGKMHKRLWLFAGALLAGLLLVAGASAMSMSPSIANDSTAQVKASHVLPAIAGVPDSPAARKAKKILVFGAEQDVDGFNTDLNCCSEYWAGVIGNTTEIRGAV